MQRLSLDELTERCQKPDYGRVGNWMARRFSRPLALRVTWLVHPWGLSAHTLTFLAWGMAVAAAFCLMRGTIWAWLAAAGLLQLWYLLDHVDGQLARLHGTASLDGVALDYLMHHTINLLVPLGAGWGLACRRLEPWWLVAGLVWGLSLLVLGLVNDVRYKSFIQRLKRVLGELRVTGGSAAHPAPTPPVPRNVARFAVWLVRKSCEIHVIMNSLTALALMQIFASDQELATGRTYVAIMALAASLLATLTVLISLRAGTAEREFATWFHPPEGSSLTFEDGWWRIRS